MEEDDTLEALMNQLGISPAWRETRERFTTRPPAIDPNSMQSVAGQYAPRVRREDLRPLPTRQEQEREYARLQQQPREAPAYQAPMNQFADAGNTILEGTGLPSVRRSAAAFADNRPREGLEQGAMGALSLATLGVGGRSAMPGRRPMPRVAEPRVGALRPPPPRPEGSVLPVREPEPFRNSLRGGGDDLMEAARQPPDGGSQGAGALSARERDRSRTFRSQGGVVRYRDTGDAWAISETDLPPHLWNQGLGGQMYRDFIEAARAAGRSRIESDVRLTPQAERVYESLRRRGYDVQRNADGVYVVSTRGPSQ